MNSQSEVVAFEDDLLLPVESTTGGEVLQRILSNLTDRSLATATVRIPVQNLAGLIAAVGLAQNLAALRALATYGIQQGHMTLHARSVATLAGVQDAQFEAVVEALIESGEIKEWKAKEIARDNGAVGAKFP